MRFLENLIALSFLGLLCFFAPAEAVGPVKLELGVHGGALKSKEGEELHPMGGVQARIHLLSFLGVEGRVSYQEDAIDPTGHDKVKIKNIPVQISAMLYPVKLPRVGLYVLGGAGYHNVKVEGEGRFSSLSVSESTSAVHVGAGLDVKLGGTVTLNGDVRYSFLKIDALKQSLQVVSSTGDAGYWAGTIGLNFKLF